MGKTDNQLVDDVMRMNQLIRKNKKFSLEYDNHSIVFEPVERFGKYKIIVEIDSLAIAVLETFENLFLIESSELMLLGSFHFTTNYMKINIL